MVCIYWINTYPCGGLVIFNQTIAQHTDMMSDLWKEYAHADSRQVGWKVSNRLDIWCRN
jgi:hypothetical protein